MGCYKCNDKYDTVVPMIRIMARALITQLYLQLALDLQEVHHPERNVELKRGLRGMEYHCP